MIFFNRSNYRSYIYGNIITPNLIYKINNFEEQFVYRIRSEISNEQIIQILNDVFCPIIGNDDSYPYQCDQYEEFSFLSLKNIGNVIYNNEIYDRETFLNKYELKKFNDNDIVLISNDIEYNEKIKRK
jgi:hypothetical protein